MEVFCILGIGFNIWNFSTSKYYSFIYCIVKKSVSGLTPSFIESKNPCNKPLQGF